MKKLNRYIVALILCIVILFTGCGSVPDSNQAETASFSVPVSLEAPPAVPPPVVTGNVDGIITKISENRLTVQNQNGEYLLFTLPKGDSESKPTTDNLVLGSVINIIYIVLPDEDTAIVSEVKESSVSAPLSTEDYQTILAIIETVLQKDKESLSKLISYPAFVSASGEVMRVGQIKLSAAEVMEMNSDALFNETFVTAVYNTNLWNLSESTGRSGIALGFTDPLTSINLYRADDGSLSIGVICADAVNIP